MTRIAPLALVLLVACDPPGVTPGETETLDFEEPNTYPSDALFDKVGLDTPVAVGAVADIGVHGEDELTLTGSSDDTAVFAVEEDGQPYVRVRALSEGEAKITVQTDDDREDRITLSALAPNDATVFVNQGLFAGATEHALATANGYALRPDAALKLSATPLSGGSPLLGFDLFEWSDAAGVLEITDELSPVNTVQITHPGGDAGLSTVETQVGGSFEVARLAADDVPTLVTYSLADIDDPVEITTLEGDDADFFALIPYDAEGRFVQPSRADADAFEVTVLSGSVVVKGASWTDGGVILRACEGTGIVELSLANGTLERPITVDADNASGDC